MQLFKRVLLPFLWGKRTFSVPSLGETGERSENGNRNCLKWQRNCWEMATKIVSEITDPLYLPLKIRLSERRRSLLILPSVRILSKEGRTGLPVS